MKYLVLFDFDGTLTKKDSLIDFLQFSVSFPKLLFGAIYLSPVLFAYLLKRIDNHAAKEKILGYFFSGWESTRLESVGDQYALKRVPRILYNEAQQCIQWHREQGHIICIVSASPDIWLRAWAKRQEIYLISTQLEMYKGRFSGKFMGRNCYGIEKVNRIKKQFDLDKYNILYAYGDSAGDRPMLSLADKSIYKPFRA